MVKEIKRDLLSLFKSPFSLFILLIPAPLIAVLLYFTFGSGALYKMPIGIINQDQTLTSQDIILSLDASVSVKVIKEYEDLQDAKEDLRNAKIFALLILPYGLQSNSKKGIPTSIPLYYNAQFLLVAKTLQSKIMQIIATHNVKLKMAKNLVENKTFIGALSKSTPIMQQITALYNPDSSYSQFLLTAIFPCSLVILVCASLLNALIRDPRSAFKEKVEIGEMLSVLCAKVFNNTIFYLGWWFLMMLFFTYIMDLPMRGEWWILWLGALIMILAYNAITLFIFAIAKESTRAISFISVYSAPSFAFAGITFPTNSMNTFALFWSALLPVSYYLQLYIQQANYGGSIAMALKICFSMLPFMLFGLIGAVIYTLRGCK
ncbi:ABC transporter permease [Helicobacter cholecystus]|uniref:ABC transporter permease n=1 Tax=Helicobacter cholecystus TaxID=45498 RepID=A0A3D8ISH2_9HELI|nr:ABC transporter permease [Helicobacter cholecystus]RDU68229.1 ABC transporter permease [Helicobacter cholecystus]VEJ24473.1 putative ABC transporter permease protein [Helicobacter cholecystus]